MPTLSLDRGMNTADIIGAVIALREQVGSQCDDVTITFGSLGIPAITTDAGNVLSAIAKNIVRNPADGAATFSELVSELSMFGVDLRYMDQAIEVDQYRSNLPPITNCHGNTPMV